MPLRRGAFGRAQLGGQRCNLGGTRENPSPWSLVWRTVALRTIRGERGTLISGFTWVIWKEGLGMCGIHGRVIDDQVDLLATSTAPSHSWLEDGCVQFVKISPSAVSHSDPRSRVYACQGTADQVFYLSTAIVNGQQRSFPQRLFSLLRWLFQGRSGSDLNNNCNGILPRFRFGQLGRAAGAADVVHLNLPS